MKKPAKNPSGEGSKNNHDSPLSAINKNKAIGWIACSVLPHKIREGLSVEYDIFTKVDSALRRPLERL